jgi:hypothetical protein
MCSFGHIPRTHVIVDVGAITGHDVIKYNDVTHAQRKTIMASSYTHSVTLILTNEGN